MYIYAGISEPNSLVDAYAVDMDMHVHVVKRWVNHEQGSDEWEPNKMFKKRDFQEQDPPRTLQEFYARYDSSVGYGTAMALTLMMVFCLSSTILKFIFKRIRRVYRSKFVQHKLLHKPKRIETNEQFTPTESQRDKLWKRRVSQMSASLNPIHIASMTSPATVQVHVIGPTPTASHHCLITASIPITNSKLQPVSHGRLLSVASTSSAGSSGDESYFSCQDDTVQQLLSPDESTLTESTLTTASTTLAEDRPLVHSPILRSHDKQIRSTVKFTLPNNCT